MPANWYISRLPAALVTLLLIGLLCGGAVAAQYTVDTLPFSQTLKKEGSSEYSEVLKFYYTGTWSNPLVDLVICTRNVQYWPSLTYVTLSMPKDYAVETKNGLDVYYKRPSDDTVQPARLYIQKKRDILGTVTETVITIFPQNWEVGSATGLKMCPLYYDAACTQPVQFQGLTPGITGHCLVGDEFFCGVYTRQLKSGTYYAMPPHTGDIGYTGIGYYEWLHDVEMSEAYGDFIEVSIDRHGDYSLIEAYSGNENIFRLSGTENINQIVPKTFGTNVTISSPSLSIFDEFIYQEVGGEPEEPEKGVNKTFSVFIKDGNTYEPIDEANVSFKRYDTGEWLLNKTIYNGYVSVTLPTGWYYVYVTSPGYYQPYPVQIVVDENLVSSIFRIYPAGESPEPEEPTEFLDLTVSVKNSQTGALIGGSEIGIRRYGDTGFYQNLTLSSGYTTVFLPPGNYEIFAEAPGYYQVYPARITLDQPHENIGVFLQPITPIPEEGNVTLNLWVCYVERGSGQAVGIPYADILISGISGDGIGYSSGSLITDMGGYLTLDIPANTEYIAYAEKPGYLAGTNHFAVYDVSPVNLTIQMIKEIPPTLPIVTPPPTMPTPPTPTEPLGFMETSGKAIGDLFGVSLELGKMMLGGLICLAVGTATAKNLKGGAPEFCVGFLGAAFLTTMGGLIPVGFFVAMLLLMGIYIARAYLLGGENGG